MVEYRCVTPAPNSTPERTAMPMMAGQPANLRRNALSPLSSGGGLSPSFPRSSHVTSVLPLGSFSSPFSPAISPVTSPFLVFHMSRATRNSHSPPIANAVDDRSPIHWPKYSCRVMPQVVAMNVATAAVLHPNIRLATPQVPKQSSNITRVPNIPSSPTYMSHEISTEGPGGQWFT